MGAGIAGARWPVVRGVLAVHWPAFVSMLVASVIFAAAVSLYPPLVVHSDAMAYTATAYKLTTQGTYSFVADGDPEADHPPDAALMPGYPVFLAAFYSLADEDSNLVEAVRDVHPLVLGGQFLLAVATVGLIAGSGAVLGGPLMSLAAGLLAAGYLPFAWASSVAQTESLAVFLSSLQLMITLILLHEDRPPGRWAVLAFGVVTGLITIVRPILVLWALVPVAWVLLRRRVSPPGLVRLAAIGAVGFLLVLAPWWTRNAAVLHEFYPLTGPNANGVGLGGARLDAQGGWELSQEEWSVYNRAEARGEDAAAAVADMRIEREWGAGRRAFVLKRLRHTRDVVLWPFFFWEAVITMDVQSPSHMVRVRFGPPLMEATDALQDARAGIVEYHRTLIVLALVGLLFVRRWPRFLLVASAPIYVVVLHSAILFHSRYFFLAMPAVVLLAAAAICGVALRLHESYELAFPSPKTTVEA